MAKTATRASWRQQGMVGTSARLWLIARRVVATSLVICLAGLFVWLIVLPWLRPRTYLIYLTSGQYEELNGQPIEFVKEDFDAIKPLESALARHGNSESQLPLTEEPRQIQGPD